MESTSRSILDSIIKLKDCTSNYPHSLYMGLAKFSVVFPLLVTCCGGGTWPPQTEQNNTTSV